MNDTVHRLVSRWWPVVPALVIYALLANHLNFTQDDSYISYRYVANFLHGDGLVYNIGERIEGFTNFGWVVFMAAWGVVGIDFIAVSKIAGFLLGGGVVCITFLLSTLVFDDRQWLYRLLVVLLTGATQSLAYWSPAGLETAAFAFFALLGLYWFATRHRLLTFAMIMAVWLRPEGALLCALLIVIEAVQTRRIPKFTLACAGLAFVMSLPYVGFKIWYYGGILPNPFYAKTSFSGDQLSNGLEYVLRFYQHYGFWGAGLVIPLLFYRRLTTVARAVWLYVVLYSVYILLVGGDVLKVHRFFIPVIGPAALLAVLSVFLLTQRLTKQLRVVLAVAIGAGMLAATYFLPHDFVSKYNLSERAFVQKQQFKANALKDSDSSDFSVALATIGVFGYELMGHEVIDLLGLTDSTIARSSEEPIPGMETTWKEQKHNSRYLLEKAPDYIVFSTGTKPSAPAERALLLYRQFTDVYRSLGWYYRNEELGGRGVLAIIFKRTHPMTGEIVPAFPVEYVEEYKLGLDAHTRRDQQAAIQHYAKALRASTAPHYVNLVYQYGYAWLALREFEKGEAVLNELVARDSTVFEAHKDLYLLALDAGDQGKAAIHGRWLRKLVPWYWERFESLARQQLGR
ncbi:MAG: hypothetical protein KKA42_04725 [candidate division Zixibacteria bacterium]|nr:hypothetical protein [candidate division Zixibacteria bacterium]